MTTEEYIARCHFCSLGDSDKRGIIKVTASRDDKPDLVDERINYECGVGKKNCSVLKLYESIYHANQQIIQLDRRTVGSITFG